MPSELAPIVRRLGLTRTGEGRATRHRGSVGGVDVVVIRSGIGTERARTATERLLDDSASDGAPVDHVMVVGIAGGIGPSRVRDLILPAAVRDHASGREFEPEPLAGARAGTGTIVTSDEFLIAPDVVDRLVAQGVIALDMETAAVGEVCTTRGVPWSAVRVISDRADDHSDKSVLELANPDGSPNIGAALRFMLRHPNRLPKLMRLARDSKAAADAAAAEAARQIEHLGGGGDASAAESGAC